jgi:hypothetical protein
MKENNKKIGKYLIIMSEEIGSGSFSHTYKAHSIKNPAEIYACKIIDKIEIKNQNINLVYFIERVRD